MSILTREQINDLNRTLEEDFKNGTMGEKIRDDPTYPFSQLDNYEKIPTPDHIIIEKSQNEINQLFIIIVVLSVLLFYFAFMV